mmetsp:Transcript_44608/g.105770  ORF Transcript_44608/g.105770 Transcript_44608/m.105770 type:complete len:198 (-) Transcript_44608:120-713(-)
MPFDPERPSPVVPNSHQAREWKQNKGPQWLCDACGEANENMAPYCLGCGRMRPEERALRLQARAGQGLGRAGGYYERSEPVERRDDDEDICDIYGRRRHKPSSGAAASSSSAAGEPAGAPDVASQAATAAAPQEGSDKPLSKAERQKLALERLKNPGARKVALSPPRTREFREPSSRSRSRKRKQQKQGFILSGGLK